MKKEKIIIKKCGCKFRYDGWLPCQRADEICEQHWQEIVQRSIEQKIQT